MHAEFPKIAMASHASLSLINCIQKSDDSLTSFLIDSVNCFYKHVAQLQNNVGINSKLVYSTNNYLMKR